MQSKVGEEIVSLAPEWRNRRSYPFRSWVIFKRCDWQRMIGVAATQKENNGSDLQQVHRNKLFLKKEFLRCWIQSASDAFPTLVCVSTNRSSVFDLPILTIQHVLLSLLLTMFFLTKRRRSSLRERISTSVWSIQMQKCSKMGFLLIWYHLPNEKIWGLVRSNTTNRRLFQQWYFGVSRSLSLAVDGEAEDFEVSKVCIRWFSVEGKSNFFIEISRFRCNIEVTECFSRDSRSTARQSRRGTSAAQSDTHATIVDPLGDRFSIGRSSSKVEYFPAPSPLPARKSKARAKTTGEQRWIDKPTSWCRSPGRWTFCSDQIHTQWCLSHAPRHTCSYRQWYHFPAGTPCRSSFEWPAEHRKRPATTWKHFLSYEISQKLSAYLVMINGTRWPRCISSDNGPQPVYKKNRFFCSYALTINSRSLTDQKEAWHNWVRGWMNLWEAKIPRRMRWWTGFWMIDSMRMMSSGGILGEPAWDKLKFNNLEKVEYEWAHRNRFLSRGCWLRSVCGSVVSAARGMLSSSSLSSSGNMNMDDRFFASYINLPA